MRLNRWRLFVSQYFTYTRRERNGILFLAALLMIMQGIYWTLYILPDPQQVIPDKDMLARLAMLDSMQNATSSFKKYPYPEIHYEKRTTEAVLTFFDPNKLDATDWQHLGLSEKQSRAIVNWVNKGGTFKSGQDVLRMRYISDRIKERIIPYVRIDTTAFATLQKPVYQKPSFKQNIIELNTATDSILMELPMIGEGRARAIIRYRTKLGGFRDASQLNEIRVLPDSVIQGMLLRIRIDSSIIQTISVNSKLDSIQHPYLSKAMAKRIESYRKEHGPFNSVEDLHSRGLLNDSIFNKLFGYLKL